ncbi:MAG TPA: aldose 1-epimerase [Puia sp.]|nr:aldose 1-epimerase [Puia sp.]
MSFSISRSIQNGLDLVVLTDKNAETEIAVLPSFGALLHAFKVKLDDELLNIIDNYKNYEEAEKFIGINFKSPKLSPFPCRIPDGKYTIADNEFEFVNKFMDGSAIHGLLYKKPFEVVDEYADDKMASLVLKYDYKKDDAGYPFDYRCEIRYLLKPDNLLSVQTVVSNLSETEMPLADGWHPYFRLGDSVNNCSLKFNGGKIVEFNEKLIPTGKLISYDLFNEPRLLKDIQLDNCFVPRHQNVEAVCEIYNPSNKLKISFFTDESYPYLQIYTPDDRQSIAVENLSGAPNCFNNKMGLIMLQPRHSQTFTVQYQAKVG